jgi:GxxExxY protein
MIKSKVLLYKKLSYQIQGIALEVRKNFGSGHKELIYQKAFEELLKIRNILYKREVKIKVYSPLTGEVMGVYQPDFLVDDKIIIELKAKRIIPRDLMMGIYDYLRNSKYELGYFINFTSPKLFIKRVIYTNDRKPWLNLRGNSCIY